MEVSPSIQPTRWIRLWNCTEMNPLLKSLVLGLIVVGLAGCGSPWRGPIPDGEIVYQGEGIYNSAGHVLGFVRANGDNNQIIEPDRQFDKAVWSVDGNFLYGLSDSSGSYWGYPAYWDLQNDRFGVCRRNFIEFQQIQGSGNPNNPYEVIVQGSRMIITIDLTHCEQINTLVDSSAKPGHVIDLAGFSYYSATKELVFSEGENLYDQGREYRLVYLNVNTGVREFLAEGISPSWSLMDLRLLILVLMVYMC
jgi:hypothetical protein